MTKYKSEQPYMEIEAERFLPPYGIPRGVMNVYSSADGTSYSGQIWTIDNTIKNVKPGEWVIKELVDNTERYYTMTDESFKQKFKPVNVPTEDQVLKTIFDNVFIRGIDLEDYKYNFSNEQSGLYDALVELFLNPNKKK